MNPVEKRAAVLDERDAMVPHRGAALRRPNVKGLVTGRALPFPRGGDTTAAVDQLVEVL